MRILKHIKTVSSEHHTQIQTFIVEYPRLIHSEMLTHRLFSRNTSSSRAIPTVKMDDIPDHIPQILYKNCKGMSGKELMNQQDTKQAIKLIEDLHKQAKKTVKYLSCLGVHKQHANRYLEPFKMIQTIITGTEWDNFYNLRISEHAQPEIREIAKLMKESKPKIVNSNVHLPFGIREDYNLKDNIIFNVALSARISYGLSLCINIDDANRIYNNLLNDKHMSPFEHVAFARNDKEFYANFKSWQSQRNIVESEKL